MNKTLVIAVVVLANALLINNVVAAGGDRGRGADRADKRAVERNTDRRQDRRGDHRQDHRQADRGYDRRDHRQDHRRDDRREDYWKVRIGLRLLTLPGRYSPILVGPTTYYYYDGVYLVKEGAGYVVVSAPMNASVGVLPYGFRSFWVGPRRYFHANSNYYSWVPASRHYVVIKKPNGTDVSSFGVATDPVVYPAEGQSENLMDQDRYECHRWSLEQANFDPTLVESQSASEQDRYYRSLRACLGGRGYTVA
jgi:hypothetical protein